MFTNAELLPTLVQVLGDCPKLNSIIYDGEPKGDIVAKLQAVREGVKLITIAELEALGRNQSEIKVVPPKRDDTCCVMYTSVRVLLRGGMKVSQLTPPSLDRVCMPPGLNRHPQGCHSHARQPHLVGRRCLPPALRDLQRAGRLPCVPVRPFLTGCYLILPPELTCS